MAADDVLAGLTRRQLQELAAKIDRQLQACAIDGREGAEPYRIRRGNVDASILLCKPCFERLRLPASRADEATS
jgi:hypothetical protein